MQRKRLSPLRGIYTTDQRFASRYTNTSCPSPIRKVDIRNTLFLLLRSKQNSSRNVAFS